MVNITADLEASFLALSAADLQKLTDWPDALIEDYLAILRGFLTLGNLIETDIDGEISTNSNLISTTIGKLSVMDKDLSDLNGDTSANSGLIYETIGRLIQLQRDHDELNARESADYSFNLTVTSSIFGAPPDIGTLRRSKGNFTTLTANEVLPSSDGSGSLGASALGWANLFLAAAAVIDLGDGDVTITHSAGKITLGGDGAVEFDFNNHEMTNVDINSGTMDGVIIGAAVAANITGVSITATRLIIGAFTLDVNEWEFLDGQDQKVTSTSSPTFVNLSITSMASNWTNAGRTIADLGIVTTVDINGGSIDGVIIGASVPANITGVSITATRIIIGGNTLDTNEWAFLDGQNQTVATSSSPTFVNLSVTTITATGAGKFATVQAKGASSSFGSMVRTCENNFVSGTGISGTDNTAEDLKTIVLPANSLTQNGDRCRIRAFWTGDTGAAITGTIEVNGVPVADHTDLGAATWQVVETWLHYIDSTHANIMEQEAGELGDLSAANVAGFDFTSDQDVIFSQNAAAGNHIMLYFFAIDFYPR